MATESAKLVIGTRSSPLAMAQALSVQQLLMQAHGWSAEMLPLASMTTSGDTYADRALSEIGGKGLFTRELDVAQSSSQIDIAVHSAKDLPTVLADGLEIVGYLPREDVRDVFISHKAKTLADLPHGAVVGSAALRRQAQIKRLRPDLEVVLLRGNVGTRLAKLERGEVDATLLAMAGLKRLDKTDVITSILDPETFLPAVAQGAIAITIRTGDERARQAVLPILDNDTGITVTAERAFLTVLDGSCRTPIAGHAQLKGNQIYFKGRVLRPDGSEIYEVERSGAISDAEMIGRDAGLDIKARMPTDFLDPANMR
ncbi:hydroxymethylbilane synthase [Microvirga sp. W0021]|uniref:Porphobilinogen deaminase n=1 Tax=Hohaiivirga grylli TaxID=3133970 RepID=A0ABV0BGU0_9HYPH